MSTSLVHVRPLTERRSARLLPIVLAETRGEVLKALRLPAYLLPVLAFPAMFYVLFGIVFGGSAGGTSMATYLLASYGAFGVIGAALFGLGVGVAAERGQGWLTLKRATPLPPLAYFAAKSLMSMLIGACIVALIAALGVVLGDVRLSGGAWLHLFTVLTLGTVPFCAFGCLLGYIAGPSSAPAIANLIYLPMSIASGLWIPIDQLPRVLQAAAPLLPPYHLAQLALEPVTGARGGTLVHALSLVAFTSLFLAAAVVAYRRDNDRTWG